MKNIRQLKKFIETAAPGESFYINFMTCPISWISFIREMIQAGKVKPDMSFIEAHVLPEYRHFYESGEALLPSGTFFICDNKGGVVK